MAVNDGRDDENGGHQDSRQGDFSRNGHQIFFDEEQTVGLSNLVLAVILWKYCVSQ